MLSRALGKSIKAKNTLVNSSIFFAGVASVIFLVHLIFTEMNFYVFIQSDVLMWIGSLLIILGLIFSSIASLSLKNSWRIGVNQQEDTELITGGIFKYSRNPYFLSYDVVLTGMVFCMPSPVLLLPVLISIILFHQMILREEKYLSSKHGDKYEQYRKEVRRYIGFGLK